MLFSNKKYYRQKKLTFAYLSPVFISQNRAERLRPGNKVFFIKLSTISELSVSHTVFLKHSTSISNRL